MKTTQTQIKDNKTPESDNQRCETGEGYGIAREHGVGVRSDLIESSRHHAFNLRMSEIIYTGSFENCVRAIVKQQATEKSRLLMI